METPATRAWLYGLVAVAFVLQGCATNITGLSLGQLSQRPHPDCDSLDAAGRRKCTSEILASLQYAEIDKDIVVFPEGQGNCASAVVDFGDGDGLQTFSNQALDNSHALRIPHTYRLWPGKKTVRIRGQGTCSGEVSRDISVGFAPNGREDYRLGYAASAMQCTAVKDTGLQTLMRLRAGTGVRITTDGGRINYGQANQTFDASGDPTAPVPAGYTFPAHRKFSLVYRIGSQLVQGEAGPVTFIAASTAPLEVCVNDNPAFLADDRGGMLLTITVNERSATP